MAYTQDPFNPYGINRFPRIYRPRASSSGGIRAGAGSQMMGPQPGGRQGSGGGIPTGGSSTTTGEAYPGQPKSFEEGLMQTFGAYKGGQKLKGAYDDAGGLKGLLKSGQDKLESGYAGLNEFITGEKSITPDQIVGNGNQLSTPLTGASVDPWFANEVPLSSSSLGVQGGGGGLASLSGNSANFANSGPMLPGGADLQFATNTSPLTGAEMAEGLQWANGEPVTGLNTATTEGAQAVNGFGAAAAGLGMGLSAYDMVENGINAGNAMGFAGAGVLGAVAMTGLTNAWNPVGWALLAGSAAYSIFG